MISDFMHSPRSLLFFSIEVRVSKVQGGYGVQVYRSTVEKPEVAAITVKTNTDCRSLAGNASRVDPSRRGRECIVQDIFGLIRMGNGRYRSRILPVRWKGTC